jgi:hypothetical protein
MKIVILATIGHDEDMGVDVFTHTYQKQFIYNMATGELDSDIQISANLKHCVSPIENFELNLKIKKALNDVIDEDEFIDEIEIF